MHPPLGVPAKQLVCGDLIAALQECHDRGILYKWSGACNSEKDALTMCLRKERIDRTTKNREESKVRNAKKYAAWAKLREEEKE
ncbi:hypothetical protein DB88DRAFT_477402 [Papiliotrema laurentii]|uniref:COX assembly mitochondrial protein n=1 Tax=Papiliotrema laurentii TaxID=5418 RepID=A0AAD9L8L1_PAPLA|nr:hypothetical protein DB88DRAFT_477402 [Papiliotrema laurentii]